MFVLREKKSQLLVVWSCTVSLGEEISLRGDVPGVNLRQADLGEWERGRGQSVQLTGMK